MMNVHQQAKRSITLTLLSLTIPGFKSLQVQISLLMSSRASYWWNYTEGEIIIMIIKPTLEFQVCTCPCITLKYRFCVTAFICESNSGSWG